MFTGQKYNRHMTTTQTAATVIDLARSHQNEGVMASSARACISDAEGARQRGEHAVACAWAVRALAYSVGIFHADYQRAAQLVAGVG